MHIYLYCYMFTIYMYTNVIITLQRFVKVGTAGPSHPKGRGGHAAVLISASHTGTQLLVIGGESDGWEVFSDAWIGDLGEVITWTEVRKTQSVLVDPSS